jgi:hypothetical protein
MPRLYFFVNAFLYIGLAVLCTAKHVQTARNLGYTELNASGHSEYLVIYGGLQLGLGLIYFFLAREPSYYGLGLLASVLLYAPIVAYRVTTLAIFKPTSAVTLGTAALEVSLLVWGVIAWKQFAK